MSTGSVQVKSVKVGSNCADYSAYHNVGVWVEGSSGGGWFPKSGGECGQSYDSCLINGNWAPFCRIYSGSIETVNQETKATLKSGDVLSVSAFECDLAKIDTLAQQITDWNLCGPKYQLEVGLPCNWVTADPKMCAKAFAGGWGFSGCMEGCATGGLNLNDRYTVILDITPSKTGCKPQTGCTSAALAASRLAHPSTELLALALVVMAFWR